MHVWAMPLVLPTRDIRGAEELLSPAEREAADSYRAGRARDEFVLTRAILRWLLGSYTGLSPLEVPLRPDGPSRGTKPRLEPELGLRFNLSHTTGLALVAVSDEEVGVDLERIDDEASLGELEGVLLSPAEAEGSGTMRSAEMLATWCRKEAVLKALGLGLSVSPTLLTIELPPPISGSGWGRARGAAIPAVMVRDLDLGGDYVGAVATPSGSPSLHCWGWLSGGKGGSVFSDLS